MSSTKDSNVNVNSQSSDASGNIYDFKDSKTSGVVVVTKTWEDSLSNEERPIPDVSISTEKPTKSPLGYTITYHGNGTNFVDDTTENEIIINSSEKIISGQYKIPEGDFLGWYSEPSCDTKITITESGIPLNFLSSDMDLYAKIKTYIVDDLYYYLSNNKPSRLIFTSELMPPDATLIDVDMDGDGGVVAWMEGSTMKVSTQKKEYKVIASRCEGMCNNSQIKEIDFENFDTSNITSMNGFFIFSPITTLNLSYLNTSKVIDMASMFYGCSSLTELDLSTFDTSSVTKMEAMFMQCSNLESLNLTSFNTSNVKTMLYMFGGCTKLRSLDLSSFNTSAVTNMDSMFSGCSNLTNIKLGDKFAFIGSDYRLPEGTWYASDGTAYTSDGTTCTIPNNKADTYTRK